MSLMGILDALQKFLNSDESDTGSHASNQYQLLNTTQLLELKSVLQAALLTHSNTPLNSKTELVSKLVLLNEELVHFSNTEQKNALEMDITAIQQDYNRHLSDAILQNALFDNLNDIQASLATIVNYMSLQSEKAQTKKKLSRRALILMTALPAFAYGMHIVMGTFFKPVFIHEAHVMFPRDVYMQSQNTFLIKDEKETEIAKHFSKYYFFDEYQHGMRERPPALGLPNAIHARALDHLVNERPEPIPEDYTLPFERDFVFLPNIHSAVKQSPSTVTLFSFLQHRVYLKNIRDNNLVNEVKVELSAINKTSFPWEKVDVSPQFDVSINSESDAMFSSHPNIRIEVKGAPLNEFKYSGKVVFTEEAKNIPFSGKLSGLTRYFDSQKLNVPEIAIDDKIRMFELAFVFPQYSERLSGERVSVAQSDSDIIDQVLYSSSKMSSESPPVISCESGASISFQNINTLAAIFDLPEISRIQFNYDYKDINLTPYEGKYERTFTKNAWLLENKISYKDELIRECLGDELYANLLGILIAPGAGSPYNTLHALNAVFADKSKVAQARVFSRHKLLFTKSVNDNLPTSSFVQYIDVSSVLNDGDILQFDIYSLGLNNGDYKFSFSIDGESKDEIFFSVLWPAHTKFDEYDYADDKSPFPLPESLNEDSN